MKNLNFKWLKAGLLSLSVLAAGFSGNLDAQTNPCNLKPEFTAKVECRTVVFYGMVDQQGASYSWTFGDGSYSNDKTVKKTYWKDGVYNVCLTVAYKGTDGKLCKITVCKEVKVGCPGKTDCKLQGGFNFYTDKNGNVKFQAFSNEGYYYYWSFGDGSSGTGKDIYHYYKKPGKYEVCLTIVSKNQKCKIRICKTVVIESRCNVMGDFSWKIDSLGNLRVEGQSNTGVYYEWMLPGSNTSKWGKVQEMKLPNCGVYEICVKIYRQDKRCFVTVCKKIEWKCPCNLKPYFNTQVNPNNPLSIYFAGGSTGGYTYTWNYGDGTSGTGASSNHVYSKAGTYKVCLVVCDQLKKCCQEICKTITVGSNSEPCLAKLGNWASSVDCKTRTLTFEGFLNGMNTYGPCVKFAWNFGDGTYANVRNGKKTYAKAGTYNVCMKVIDSCRKCDTLICRQITITDCGCKLPTGYNYSKVSGSGTLYQFEGFQVLDSGFNNGCLKYTWTWGDGTSSTGRLAKKEYKQSGTYTVCMKVADTCKKCDTTICKSVTIVNCNTQAYFIVDSIVNGRVYLRNMSTNAAYYYWSFGDSTFSADKTPSKTYAASGTYTICLMAYDQNKTCSTKICKTVTITRRAGSSARSSDAFPVSSEVFPNPAEKVLNVSWYGMTGTKVQITDLNGRVLNTKVATADESSLSFDVSGLPQGIYLVKLSDGKTTQVKRFVKNQ